MANNCFSSMYVKGSKEDVEEFIKVIKADYDYGTMEFSHDRHMFRVFSADDGELEKRNDGKYGVVINGDCAWSVASCMLEDGYYKRCKDEYRDKFRGTSLENESEILNLEIEVFSEECGMCFQEHYVIREGYVDVEECVEWYEYFLDDYETKEEAEKDLEIKITDQEWEIREIITRGGFDNWDFTID